MAYDQRRRELDQQIAELRAKIAAGAGDVGTASYILRGDTTLMDRAARAEQSAIDAALREAESEKQRKFQEAENEANRQNTMKIAMMSRSGKSDGPNIDKLQLDADIAKEEYEDATKKVDISDPDSVTRAKKAAIKYNYAMSQLPYFDKGVHTVSLEFDEDAPEIAKGKRIKSAKATVDALKNVDKKKWSDNDVALYNEALEILKRDDPDSVTQYEVILRNRPKTIQQRNSAWKKSVADYNGKGKPPTGTENGFEDGKPVLRDIKTGKILKYL